MIDTMNELELYSIKGNVKAGKMMLFRVLENKDLSEDEIKNKVVNEYQIMKPKHFVRCWNEYNKMKRYLK